MITFDTALACLTRDGSFLDVTQPFTVMGHGLRYSGAPTPGSYRQYWQWGDVTGFVTNYIYFGSDNGSDALRLAFWDGVDYSETASFTPTVNVPFTWALRYRGAGAFDFIINNALVDTLAVTLGGFTEFDEKIGTSWGDFSVAYLKSYQAALSLADIALNQARVEPVTTANLLSNSPLYMAVDLADRVRPLPLYTDQWTAVSTIGTSVVLDPLVPLTAAPAPNTTPATAIDLGTFPFMVAQALGGATDVYYTFLLPDRVDFGLRVIPSSGNPAFRLYQDVGLAEQYMNTAQGGGEIEGRAQPYQVPVLTPGQRVWLNAFQTGAVPVLAIETYELPAQDLPSYSVVVPDDTHNFPAVVFDPVTGEVLTYLPTIPASEFGASLPNGYSLSYARSTNSGVPTGDPTGAVLVNGTAVVAEITGVFPLEGPSIRGNAATNTFWVADIAVGGASLTIKQVSLTGAILQTIGPVGGFTLASAIAVSPDETIAYVLQLGSAPIKRIDLTTGTLMSDLVAAIPNYSGQQEILMQPDGSLLVPYHRSPSSAGDAVRHYSAAGVLLAEFAVSTASFPDLNHIAEAHDDGASFWAWLFDQDADGNSTGRFKRVRIADGVVIAEFISYEFNIGQGPTDGDPVSQVQWGHSNSCPFWVLTGFTPEPPIPPLPDACPPGNLATRAVNPPGACAPSTPGV